MPFGHDMPAEDSPLLEDRRAADQTVYGIVPLRELDREERPQERLERLGPAALADRELLAMILRSGSAKLDVLALSDHLLREAGSLSSMLRWTTEDFQALHTAPPPPPPYEEGCENCDIHTLTRKY